MGQLSPLSTALISLCLPNNSFSHSRGQYKQPQSRHHVEECWKGWIGNRTCKLASYWCFMKEIIQPRNDRNILEQFCMGFRIFIKVKTIKKQGQRTDPQHWRGDTKLWLAIGFVERSKQVWKLQLSCSCLLFCQKAEKVYVRRLQSCGMSAGSGEFKKNCIHSYGKTLI